MFFIRPHTALSTLYIHAFSQSFCYFLLTQPAMPAKKNNENPLYIKQKYRPDYNNNLALRTAYGTKHKQAQPHPTRHKLTHDVKTRKRAGDRKPGPSSQE